MKKITTALAATAAAATLAAGALAPASAAPSAKPQGDTSLAEVLAADGNRFDHKSQDFDVLERAVLAVLKAKPESPVGLLTQGEERATAFLPTDAAFRNLVLKLTGERPGNERQTFRQVAAAVDVDTLEAVLLYHVVAGKTLVSEKVVASKGEPTTTALGATWTVRVKGGEVRLEDQDTNARDPRVIALDVNRGNKQVAHAIDRVLRPIDL
ncbi:fasciclin domain-containing protein [Nocardioides kribbensis]|uniref:Fasciclin domain-containing protein n=1 Tax=Nocardioides kribbensis TaxID=305517 RepID=A0ABV1P0Z6_9ACTN